MSRELGCRGRVLLFVVLALACAGRVESASPKTKSADKGTDVNAQTDNYDVLFARYLDAARHVAKTTGPDIGWMIGLTGDRRARYVNDLLTVQVVENITGSGTADSALTKDGKASAAVPTIFGVEKKLAKVIDPRAVDARSAALGRYEPRRSGS